MSIILLTSITSITAALIAYIVVFFMNYRAETFTWKQMGVLLFAVATDVLGTMMMRMLANGETRWDLHTILGYGALAMMLIMSTIGLTGLLKKNQNLLDKFGKYYLSAMVLWVVSYATGVIIGLERV